MSCCCQRRLALARFKRRALFGCAAYDASEHLAEPSLMCAQAAYQLEENTDEPASILRDKLYFL
jgi:hypothetical protein